ncbi:MAG TPA: DUF3810 domain-containing protein [Flavisolibacter sp.]|jgi:hypothetical protein|nr:DUF3810 domain-containing protein [Flavisolibacter sp.]
MLKTIFRDRALLFLLVLTLAIKCFSLNESLVERYYTYGFYPVISRLLRFLTGWIPFSLGDVLYLLAFVWLVWKVWRLLRVLIRKRAREHFSALLLAKYLKLVLLIYVVFMGFWGLNYSRQGIASQLGLTVQPYTAEELYRLTAALQVKLNTYAAQEDSLKRLRLNDNRVLFRESISSYQSVKEEFPFLTYKVPSVKPSLFSAIGEYFGFTGYYNPFTGEAQLKTSVPVFVKPFILCHEIGHQLGYAKENEANFVAYLAGRKALDVDFRYSAYWDVYTYAARELSLKDSTRAKELKLTTHPRFRNDYRAYLAYLFHSQNYVEPVMSQFYDRYLRLNNQPKGKATYNEVVAWLVAYMRKYGAESL